MARRLCAIGGAALTWILLVALPASASDLTDYLRDADEAVYSGRRIVITVWGGDSEYALLDIQHAKGITIVDRYGSDVLVGGGKLKDIRSLDGAIQFVGLASDTPVARYTVHEGTPVTHAGRATVVVDVLEGGTPRARFVFDQETHAPLVTEVYNGDGRLFRYSSMVEFSVGIDDPVPLPGQDSTPYTVAAPIVTDAFPSTAGRYGFVDAFDAPDDTIQGFYSDGLFSFSLFKIDGRADIGAMVNGSEYDVGGMRYTLLVAPTEVWVLWNTASSTYVLVGDLPPDHLQEVLRDLPAPIRWNLFQRMWHNVFG